MEIKLSRNERGYHVTARLRGKEGYDLLRVDREQLVELRNLIDAELGVVMDTKEEAERAFCERVADLLWTELPDGTIKHAELRSCVKRAITAVRWATPPKSLHDLTWDKLKEQTAKAEQRAAEMLAPFKSPWNKIEAEMNAYTRHDPTTFRPGLYEHYRGGRYVALFLAEHHDTREKYVVYVSCQHETVNVRPWARTGEDSWTDEVEVPIKDERGYADLDLGRRRVPHFKFVEEKR